MITATNTKSQTRWLLVLVESVEADYMSTFSFVYKLKIYDLTHIYSSNCVYIHSATQEQLIFQLFSKRVRVMGGLLI